MEVRGHISNPGRGELRHRLRFWRELDRNGDDAAERELRWDRGIFVFFIFHRKVAAVPNEEGAAFDKNLVITFEDVVVGVSVPVLGCQHSRCGCFWRLQY